MNHPGRIAIGLTAIGVLVAVGLNRQPIPPRGPAIALTHRIAVLSATRSELQLLPGIGPVLADRLLTWRSTRRSPVEACDLLEIRGIGPRTLSGIMPHMTIAPPNSTPADCWPPA